MIYVYDVLLNFNYKELPFFEWEDTDDIKYARKIPLFKVSSKTLSFLIDYVLEFPIEFLLNIKDKTSFYDEDTKIYQYVSLFSDGNKVIALSFSDNKSLYISSLLLDSESEVLKESDVLDEQNISYKIIKKRDKSNSTRYEDKIKKELLLELDYLYNNNLIDKLNYCYFEYYNESINDKDKAYFLLKESIENDFNKRHINLHEMIKLSYQNKQNN